MLRRYRSIAARVRLIRGDITELDVDAFVFYAQPDLALGSGFGTAISVRGGPSIQKELDELGPVETGQAVVTGAGKLKADFIVHAVGPRFQEEDTEGKLRTTVLNSLKAAEEKGVKRIALPAMGAGFLRRAVGRVCAGHDRGDQELPGRRNGNSRRSSSVWWTSASSHPSSRSLRP